MNQAETVLVVGADGMIGRALADRLAAGGRNVVRTTLVPTPGAVALDLARDAADLDAAAGSDRLSLRRGHFAGPMPRGIRRQRGP